MAKKSRYQLLCEAYDRGVNECSQYQTECREFVRDLKNSILESLSCVETKLYMYPPTNGFDYRPHLQHGDALDTEFYEDGVAGIGFALNLNGEGLDEKLFAFVVTFTKAGSKIRFRVDDENEFVNTPEGIEEFCDYLFKLSEQILINRLASFLQSPKQPAEIGFKISHKS